MTTPLASIAQPSAAVAGVRDLNRLLDHLHEVDDGEVGPEEHEELVTGYERAARKLESLRLREVARADTARVADKVGLADTSSWLARRTHPESAGAARDVQLAAALAPTIEGQRPCATALAAGDLSSAHARVIVHAINQLPTRLTPTAVLVVERDLVAQASRFSPDQLRRIARRALAAVEPDPVVVDAHEDTLVRSEEDAALARTRLSLHDNGDGTTSGHFTVPTLAAAILTRAIHSMTAPRCARLGATTSQAGASLAGRDWAHQAGLALVELLEHLPTDRLHSKVAATVVVTIDREKLRTEVGTAALDNNDTISAGELRRIACGAGILPAILNGPSLPLDLGRTQRLFVEAQRVALATRLRTCAADGCERPFSWCELHHEIAWHLGGRTDLRRAIPLCAFHHRRIHDPDYRHELGPDGLIFTRRARGQVHGPEVTGGSVGGSVGPSGGEPVGGSVGTTRGGSNCAPVG